MLKISFDLLINGRLEHFSKPEVMGILNLTPDSFYAGSRINSDKVAETAAAMIESGARIVDIGGQSTRPGAERLSAEQEMDRVIPAIEAIYKALPRAIISIDTFYASVAREAVSAGAAIINDVSAGSIDSDMFQTAADLHVPYVLMHMQGQPQTMQKAPQYSDVTSEVFRFFSDKINELHQLGVHDILLDPGFGFGKTMAHNYQLLRELSAFESLHRPLLIGLSRKKMIQNAIQSDADQALAGTIAANTIALMNGASILRVHDVKEAMDAIRVYEQYGQNQ